MRKHWKRVYNIWKLHNQTVMFYNEDCIVGSQKYLKTNSVDLIISDPPYWINGDKLDKRYNRDESNVLDGYVEVPEN